MLHIGDLVELSAYGKKLQCLERYRGRVGMVLNSHFESVKVDWIAPHLLREKWRPIRMNRRDVKTFSRLES